MVIADVNVGILFVFAIASLGVYGIVIGGWASSSKYPFLGGIRSSAQMLSYELSLGLAVIPIFMLVGNLRLTNVVRYQIEHGWFIAPFIGDWANNTSLLVQQPLCSAGYTRTGVGSIWAGANVAGIYMQEVSLGNQDCYWFNASGSAKDSQFAGCEVQCCRVPGQ